MLGLIAILATPTLFAAWWLASESDTGLLSVAFLYFMVSPLVGAAIVVAAGHLVFGDAIGVRGTLGTVLRRLPALITVLVISRLAILAGAFALVIPGVLIVLRFAFHFEAMLLERQPLSQVGRRTLSLLRGFWKLLEDFLRTQVYHGVLIVTIFVLVDRGSELLFDAPILAGRLPTDSTGLFFDSLVDHIAHDPLVVTTLLAVTWLTYPAARLAWFFRYLDVRIRRECWDLELDFKVEAQRLEGVS